MLFNLGNLRIAHAVVGTAAKVMTKELEGMKDITLAQNKVTVLGSLNDASRAQIEVLADELSK